MNKTMTPFRRAWLTPSCAASALLLRRTSAVTPRRTTVLLLVAALAACGPDAPEGSPEGSPAGGGDAGGAATAGPLGGETAGGGLQDSIPRTVLDSLREAMAELTLRQDEILRENEALRTTLITLVGALPGGGAPGGATPPVEGADVGSPVPGQGTLASAGEGVIQTVQDARSTVGNLGLKSFLAVVWLILMGLLIRGSIYVLEYLSETSAARRLFYKRLVPITRILIWIFAFYIALVVIFQVNYQGVLAAGAAVGVAVGFAAQDILKNIFGGLIVIFDQPFQVGDKISVAGTYGEVVSIGLRSTRLVTSDDNLVSVPNAQVVDGQVANANAGELNCQVVTHLYLPGWVDESRAKHIAFEAATTSKYVYLKKPIAVIVTDEFHERLVTHLKVKAYVLDPRHEFLFMSDVTERARAGFREAGLLRPNHDGELAQDAETAT